VAGCCLFGEILRSESRHDEFPCHCGSQGEVTTHHKTHHYQVDVKWTGNTGQEASYRAYDRSHETAVNRSFQAHLIQRFGVIRPDTTRKNCWLLLSACHMLWYLHLCAEAGIVVTDYVDRPVGELRRMVGGGRPKWCSSCCNGETWQ